MSLRHQGDVQIDTILAGVYSSKKLRLGFRKTTEAAESAIVGCIKQLCLKLSPIAISPPSPTMLKTFKYTFDTQVYKGTITLNTGLFIDGKWVEAINEESIKVFNPANGTLITSIIGGSKEDVDLAVAAAKRAYKTSWGLKVPGSVRGRLLAKLADLVEANIDEIAALDALNNGLLFPQALAFCRGALGLLRYYAGAADKIEGQTIETSENKLAYTRREPYGVVAVILPWNVPTFCMFGKLAPALAAGNTVLLKPSEITPLSALRIADLINEAGFPPGVVNIVNGYGPTVGTAISEHLDIAKISFTGSTMTGRKIQEASARSNLKVVTLELGGKSPSIVFDDANLEQTVQWIARGIYTISGQICTAGSRIYVQEGLYDNGDPFLPESRFGPLASRAQFDRVQEYIESGKSQGGTIHSGGERSGNEGYFIQPTIFTNCTPDMKIVREEIFGPVSVITKFSTEEEVLEMANNTTYGLACGVFTQNGSRAIRVAHGLEAGVAFVNCYNELQKNVPFGGFKQSGIGREYGQAGLEAFTQIKSIIINLETVI
ncbi:aldehyde dehydrogenase [Mycena floridula]|nr:aldehyde dehydrogenase [Mycena floridula]